MTLLTEDRPLASTIISPATDDVMSTFHSTNQTLGAFVASVYLLGYFCGPLFLAHLSEIYGRVIIYKICNFLFLTFNVVCALTPSLNALTVFRVFAGVAASCPMTLGAGTIADLVPVEKRGLALASWIIGPLVGPIVGPLGSCHYINHRRNTN
jgi:MFS family permease